VAATARCKNDGKDANPTIATPPLFKKYRLEMFIAFSLLAKQSKNLRRVLPKCLVADLGRAQLAAANAPTKASLR
jgi:hypothetical protein